MNDDDPASPATAADSALVPVAPHAASGAGLRIRAGLADSPFGTCVIGETPQGICHLSFPEPMDDPMAELHRAWPAATVKQDHRLAADWADLIFSPTMDRQTHPRLLVAGSRFQQHIWRCLLDVPPGSCLTYGELAAIAGCPQAARAVGTAVGRNAIAWLIPCHRVIRADGSSGGYRWNPARKLAMLAWEKQHTTPS